MKREILFKAKRVDNNEWVEGFPIQVEGLWYIFEVGTSFTHNSRTGNGGYASLGSGENMYVGDMHISKNNPKGELVEVWHSTVCQFTGLLDKNGNKGYFGDIWQIKDFKYNVNYHNGFQTKTTDLKFYLTNNPLQFGYVLVYAPKDLKRIALNVIFNLPNSDEKRIFIDDNRQKLEIISNIHDK